MSWWWIVALAVAFIWFEFIEKMLGLDKKKAHNVDEARRKARVKNSFDKKSDSGSVKFGVCKFGVRALFQETASDQSALPARFPN
jgi:hypothetical protein